MDLYFIEDMYDGIKKKTGFFKHYYTLYAVVEGLETQCSFEFGTGLSTEVILCALEKTAGHHISCDTRLLSETGMSIDSHERWTFVQDDSRKVAKETTGLFDFVLHDGAHNPDIITEDISAIIPKMKQNAILMMHDTESTNYGTSLKDAMIACLDIKHEILTLPYSYGLTLVRILEDQGNGKVKPKWEK